MVDLCTAERLGWMSLTVVSALVAALPWMRPIAAHGKLMGQVGNDGSLKGWLQAGTPKRWFVHFYLAGLVSCVVALVDILLFGGSLITRQLQSQSVCSRAAARNYQAAELGAESLVCLVLLTMQIGRRLWESLAVTQWGSSRMSHADYVLGILHYQMLVLTVLVEAPPLHIVVEGASNSGVKGALEAAVRLVLSMNLRHAVAVGIFFVGFARQHEAIRHLASLRVSPADGKATTSTYAMPMEGWFQYVSCAHYFAELLIYWSYVLLAGARGGGLGQGYILVAIWVFSNQSYMAGCAHAWYQRKFEDYPRGRKRLIPGVW